MFGAEAAAKVKESIAASCFQRVSMSSKPKSIAITTIVTTIVAGKEVDGAVVEVGTAALGETMLGLGHQLPNLRNTHRVGGGEVTIMVHLIGYGMDGATKHGQVMDGMGTIRQ